MKKIEVWLLVLIAGMAVAFFAYYYLEATLIRHLDSVFLFESVEGILRAGIPVSETVASWPLVVNTLSMVPSEVCSLPFGFPLTDYNVLQSHAYFALYPIAVLSALVGVEVAFASVNAAAHLALVLLPFLFLRRRGVGILPAAAFALCVLVYPGWSLSSMGDYYLDRFYMPCMLALLYVMHELVIRQTPRLRKWTLSGMIFLALIAASFTERAAIMVMASLAFFLAFFPELRRGKTVNRVAVGIFVALAIYLVWYFTFLYQPIGSGLINSALRSPAQFIEGFQRPGVIPFLLTNMLFLGWMALFAGWRYLLLLLGAILPNFLITVGGAELTGWSTHYHAMYIPFLIFVASTGFLDLNRRLAGSIHGASLSSLAGGLAVAFAAYFNPHTATWGKNFLDNGNSGIAGAVYLFYFVPELSRERAMVHWLRELDSTIPFNSKVSAIEGVMPALYNSRQLALYPYGMDEADYLVISGTGSDGVPSIVSGASNYVNEVKVNSCLAERIAEQGFVLDGDIRAIGVLIFKNSGRQ